MKGKDDWVIIGRFGRVHGVKGFISVHSFTDPRDNILDYPVWRILVRDQWCDIVTLDRRPMGNKIISLVKGYETRELASTLVNADIAVTRAEMPAPEQGEYYWHDLIGMEVINLQGYAFGKISEIISTGANDVLLVQGEQKHLIPYLTEKVIIEVNLEKRCMTVDWEQDF